MTTRTYGFARPLKHDDIKPGMLIAARYGNRKVLGLAFQGDRETLVAIFDDNGEEDPQPPYVVDLGDIYQTAVMIPGQRELVPAEGDAPFALLPQRRSGIEGLVICSDGTVAIAVSHHDLGMKKYQIINFDTGTPVSQGGQMAALPDWQLFVVEDGQTKRRLVSASA